MTSRPLNAAGFITQSELNRLCEERKKLLEVLRPFAHFASALPPVVKGHPRLTDNGPAFTCRSVSNPTGPEHVITFRDLREALALYETLEAADKLREDIHLARTEDELLGNCPDAKSGHHLPIRTKGTQRIVCLSCDKELPWYCSDCFSLAEDGSDERCAAHR